MKKTGLAKSQQTIQKAQVPLLSYKAEIIWDPQPTYYDDYEETKKKPSYLTRQGSQKTIVTDKVSLPPFVNLERENYIQDIARRQFYYKTLKAENNVKEFQTELQSIAKIPKKKTRRHKTKFKIIKNNKNIQIMQDVIVKYINDNKKFVNTEVMRIPEYEKNAPFLPSSLQFADQLIEEKQQLKEKYGFDEKNLRKNNCILEQVVLNRLDKRLKNREKNKMIKKPFSNQESRNPQELEQKQRLLSQHSQNQDYLPKINNYNEKI